MAVHVHIHEAPATIESDLAAIRQSLGDLTRLMTLLATDVTGRLAAIESGVQQLQTSAAASAQREIAMSIDGQELLTRVREIDANTTAAATVAINVREDLQRVMQLVTQQQSGVQLDAAELAELQTLLATNVQRSAALATFLQETATISDGVELPNAPPPPGEATGA